MRRDAKEKPQDNKMSSAPNIIIPSEHQAAPRAPFINCAPANACNPKTQRIHTGGYDSEMDLPGYDSVPDVPTIDKPSQQNLEAVHEQFEKNLNDPRIKASRWKGQERWQGDENEEMRKVNIIHCNEFIRRLQRVISAGQVNHCVDDFITEMNKHHPNKDYEIIGNGGPMIWLNSFSRVGRIGVNAWVKPQPGTKAWEMRVFKCETVTTVQYPYSYEWSIMRFNEYNVPTAEKFRGWRTALLALIVKGVLSEEKAHRAFGNPQGPASAFYREQLYNYRNKRPVQVEEISVAGER